MTSPFDPPSEPAGPPPVDPTVHSTWGAAASWVPSLYFVEGLPYVVVNIVSVVMYKSLGVSNSEIAFYTSWLGLIWAFKALWSPLVDGVWTKRSWTLAMQLLMVPAILGVAFSLPLPDFVQVTLALFALVGVLSATHDIAADGFYMLGLTEGLQSAFVGIRSTFWRVALVSAEGGLVVLAGALGNQLGLVQGWTAALSIAAAVFGVGFVYHFFVLPRPADDAPRAGDEALGNTGRTFSSFLGKDGLMAGVLFLVYYRFAENHMAKIVSPFLIDDRAVGGLGLTLEQVGIAKGTVGVLALVGGGILGGIAIYRHGLKAWLWPMVIALNLPDLIYVYMAAAQPQSFPWIAALIGVESFGYGFGFSAYLMFMIRLAQGEFKTAHYAFGTGIMALAAWAAQVWSGAAEELLGYTGFFVWVCLLTVPGIWVAWLVDIPASFGRSDHEAEADVGPIRLRQAPYLTGLYLNAAFGALIMAVGLYGGDGDTMVVVAGGFLAGAGNLLTIALLAFHMWSAHPAPDRPTSPAVAAALLFAPFYNAVWAGRLFRGFASRAGQSMGLYTVFAGLTSLTLLLLSAALVGSLFVSVPVELWWAAAAVAIPNLVVTGLVIASAIPAINQRRAETTG